MEGGGGWGGGGVGWGEYPEKTFDEKLQNMPHTKAQKSKPKRDSNPHNSIGGRLGKQTC